ncbi:MAG: phage holin family protein [Candidatus Azobacteroides sp.]|nr:phage holin family protein [Candidatus Azobacteroides sp.]
MDVNLIEVLINIALSSFGGLIKSISESQRNPEKRVTFSHYMIGSSISLFVGIVVFFLCKYFELSSFLTAGITALSGYMGSPVLDILSDIAKRRLNTYLHDIGN